MRPTLRHDSIQVEKTPTLRVNFPSHHGIRRGESALPDLPCQVALLAYDGPLAKLDRLGGGRVFLAPADQSVYSGTNFLTTVLLGRLCGADELGTYSLAFTLLVLAAAAQESLVSTPYMIYAQRRRRAALRCYAGSTLVAACGDCGRGLVLFARPPRCSPRDSGRGVLPRLSRRWRPSSPSCSSASSSASSLLRTSTWARPRRWTWRLPLSSSRAWLGWLLPGDCRR